MPVPQAESILRGATSYRGETFYECIKRLKRITDFVQAPTDTASMTNVRALLRKSPITTGLSSNLVLGYVDLLSEAATYISYHRMTKPVENNPFRGVMSESRSTANTTSRNPPPPFVSAQCWTTSRKGLLPKISTQARGVFGGKSSKAGTRNPQSTSAVELRK